MSKAINRDEAISKRDFVRIFGGENNTFALPMRWDGKDFYLSLYNLFECYLECLPNVRKREIILYYRVKKVCDTVLNVIREYLYGFPSRAYEILAALLDEEFDKNPLYTDSNSVMELYRMVSVEDNISYERDRIFHVPYNMRAQIATCRYSISGYPSLYLSSSLELCNEETGLFTTKTKAIASMFWISRIYRPDINIIDFGYRPQDIANDETVSEEFSNSPETNIFDDPDVDWDLVIPRFETNRYERYMQWYPVIAACSFIRTNRSNPFAPEYILPQLMTQWSRSRTHHSIVGIRYFSCSSIKASTMGVNYVFPTSGDSIILDGKVLNYCPLINKAFTLTKPVFLPEYNTLQECDKELKNARHGKLCPPPEELFSDYTSFNVPNGVLKLDRGLFGSCGKLITVSLPDTLLHIGDYAFDGCTNLREIHFPEKLETIGKAAFEGCNSIRSISIPSKVNSIGKGAFSNCSKLSQMQVESGNTSYYSIDNTIVEYANKEVWAGCSNSVLPADGSIKSIGAEAFRECDGLNRIDLSQGLAHIKDYAFYHCSNLTNLSFPEGLKSIGEAAFSGCKRVRSIVLPRSLSHLGACAFSGCTALKAIEVDPDNKKYCSIHNCIIEKSSMTIVAGCKSSNIPSNAGIKYIADEAFQSCDGLKQIIIPSSVIKVGKNAFSFCNELIKIKFNEGITTIDDDAFLYCRNLSDITLPSSIKRIGKRAFLNCSKLSKIVFLGTVEDWEKIQKDEDWNGNTDNLVIEFTK